MSRMLLPAMSIMRIRRAGTMLIEASHDAAKRGEFLTAANYAKDAQDVWQAAWHLMQGHERGFEMLKRPTFLARGVTEKRHLGRAGRLSRAARALIARELVRGGQHKRELPYYHRPEEREARRKEERRLKRAGLRDPRRATRRRRGARS